MFLIGESIFYPVFGAGCIVNIEDKEVYGEINRYYIVELIVSKMVVMVPMYYEEEGRIRKTISRDKGDEIFDILSGEEQKLSNKWAERYRYYNMSVKEGDIYILAAILRDIAGLKRKKELSRSELKFFNDILDMVSGELALVYSTEFEDMREKIISLLDR